MLTLFRKFRKSISAVASRPASPVSRYILYAVGEIALVVIGILIALQINNWNEARLKYLSEKEFLNRLKDDLEYDFKASQELIDYFDAVYAAGLRSFSYLDSADHCNNDCTRILSSFYNATQWSTVNPRATTFNEIPVTGFPSNRILKDKITQYHRDFELIVEISKPSQYRQHIRSFIPGELQKILFTSCHPVSGEGIGTMNDDCQPNIPNDLAQEIVNVIASDPQTQPLLNYWMGTITVMMTTLTVSTTEIQELITMIEEELDGS